MPLKAQSGVPGYSGSIPPERPHGVSDRERTPPHKSTIKEFACDFFVKVNYVDVYGRNVGYDYEFILAEIKKRFPEAKTSKRWLRMMAYELNNTIRIPARRRSRRALAEGYAEVLLLRPGRTGAKAYSNISQDVRKKFVEQSIPPSDLRRVERSLISRGFAVPARPNST
jgi:hypothetical protein